METIKFTPTWESSMPALIMLIENGDAKGKAFARDELMRLARAADAVIAKCEEVEAP